MAEEQRGTFAAIPCNAHHSPALARLREMHDPLGDVYFYRAIQFCKEYCRSGCLEGQWGALATFANWPEDWESLAKLFRAAGVVDGPRDELWSWFLYNGWLIQKARKHAAAEAARRRAGRASGRARRKAKQLSLLPKSKSPVQKRLPFPRTRKGTKRTKGGG